MSKKVAEIREMSDEQLLNAIEDNRESMYRLRFSQATGELKNLNLIRDNKRELARLKTVLTQRRQAAQTVSGEGKQDGK